MFIAGTAPLAFFSQSVCDPKAFGKSDCRPVELIYPGLKRAKDYHGLKADPYMVAWHDFMLHCFRNGANPFKPLIRYMIVFLQKLKDFPMSSWMWSLCDMDDSGVGRVYRESLKALILENPSPEEYQQEVFRFKMKGLHAIFGLLKKSNAFWEQKHFFEYLDENDAVLAMLFDMWNKNPESWQPLLDGHPSKDIFTRDNHFLFILCGNNYKKFPIIFNKIKQISDANTD